MAQSFLPHPLVADQLQMSLLHHAFAEAGVSFNQTWSPIARGWRCPDPGSGAASPESALLA
jgi:hypothetical protein